MALNSFGVRQKTFAPLTGGARPPVPTVGSPAPGGNQQGTSASAQARLAAFNNIGGAINPQAYQQNQQRQQGGQPISGQSGQPQQPSQYGYGTGIGGGFNFQPQTRNDYNMQQRQGGNQQGGGQSFPGMSGTGQAGGGFAMGQEARDYLKSDAWKQEQEWQKTDPGFQAWVANGRRGNPPQSGQRQQQGGGMNGFNDGQSQQYGGGQQGGGIFGALQQRGQTLSPEQRWGQSQGALPWSKNMTGYENKFNLANYLSQNGPSLGQYAGGLQNPSQNYNNMGGAQNAAAGGFNSAYQGPGGNPYMPSGQGGGQPQAPNIQGAPTSYNTPQYNPQQFQGPQFGQPEFNGPQLNQQGLQFDQLGGQRFDPNSVQGPNINPSFGGPQSGVPGFQDIINQSRGMTGGGANAVPRENIQGSGFQQSQLFGNPNSIANQGFESALSSAQGQSQAGLNQDIFKQQSAALQKQLNAAGVRANVLAGEEIGSNGMVYNPGASGGSDEAYAKYYAPAQAEIGTKLADLAAGNLDRTIQQQQFGTSALTGLGGAASNAAQGNAGLLQGDSQFLGGSQLQQRGQDIGQNQFGAQFGADNQARNLQALTGLAGTLGGLQNESFGLGTSRGLGQGNLQNDAYGQQTQRMGTLGGLYNQGQGQDIDAYRAATERGLGQGQFGNQQNQTGIDAYNAATNRGLGMGNLGVDQSRVGLDYDQLNAQQGNFGANLNADNQFRNNQLGSQNQNQYNQQMIDLYNAQGNQYNQGQQNQQGWADLWQSGQIEAGNQGLRQGQFGLDYMNSGVNAQNQWNQQQIGANQFDMGNFWQNYSDLNDLGATAQQNREANRFNFGKAAAGALGGVTGALGNYLTGGYSGSSAGGQMQPYQGMQRQGLNINPLMFVGG